MRASDPYRTAPEPPACECATGPLFDAEDDYGVSYPICAPCIERRTVADVCRPPHAANREK